MNFKSIIELFYTRVIICIRIMRLSYPSQNFNSMVEFSPTYIGIQIPHLGLNKGCDNRSPSRRIYQQTHIRTTVPMASLEVTFYPSALSNPLTIGTSRARDTGGSGRDKVKVRTGNNQENPATGRMRTRWEENHQRRIR